MHIFDFYTELLIAAAVFVTKQRFTTNHHQSKWKKRARAGEGKTEEICLNINHFRLHLLKEGSLRLLSSRSEIPLYSVLDWGSGELKIAR